jgi:Leucyl aminopeptidase
MKLPVNITAILPITDNAVSNNAYIPSDVITAYNGKTIEILNTDAEGRMTLADGLSYLAKNYKTDALIDLATLTGSSVRMFGYTCGAYFPIITTSKNPLKFLVIKPISDFGTFRFGRFGKTTSNRMLRISKIYHQNLSEIAL